MCDLFLHVRHTIGSIQASHTWIRHKHHLKHIGYIDLRQGNKNRRSRLLTQDEILYSPKTCSKSQIFQAYEIIMKSYPVKLNLV